MDIRINKESNGLYSISKTVNGETWTYGNTTWNRIVEILNNMEVEQNEIAGQVAKKEDKDGDRRNNKDCEREYKELLNELFHCYCWGIIINSLLCLQPNCINRKLFTPDKLSACDY